MVAMTNVLCFGAYAATACVRAGACCLKAFMIGDCFGKHHSGMMTAEWLSVLLWRLKTVCMKP
jgi:hypothetical protein